MRKGFYIELDEKPKDEQAFITEIERYCVKNRLPYRFIERHNPAIIIIQKNTYKAELLLCQRIFWRGYSIHLKEV